MKYGQWLDEWLENYIKPVSKAKTAAHYGEIAKRHIAPQLGGLELSELDSGKLQSFIADKAGSGNLVTGRGLAANSVNSIITVLQGSLRAAKSRGLCEVCAADGLKRPHRREKRVECFTPDEQRRIEEWVATRKPAMLGIVICLYTGLRIGELLALEWSDIDLDAATLTVSKTSSECKNSDGVFGTVIDSPKTQSSARTIPLPNKLIPIIKKLKRASGSSYVISDRTGKPVPVRAYQRSFERMLKRLGLPHRGFHSLRHTFATRALECGMDVRTLSELLGHKNPTVTLTRYVHSLPDYKREMMNRLGKRLGI